MKRDTLFACCATDVREKRMVYFAGAPKECNVPTTEQLDTTKNAMKEGVEKAMKATMEKLNLTCINDVVIAPVDKILPILIHMQQLANANGKTIWNSAFLGDTGGMTGDDRYLFYAALQRGMKLLKPDLNLVVDGRITGKANSQTNQAHKSIGALDSQNTALKKGYFTTEFLNAFIEKLELLENPNALRLSLFNSNGESLLSHKFTKNNVLEIRISKDGTTITVVLNSSSSALSGGNEKKIYAGGSDATVENVKAKFPGVTVRQDS